MISIASSHSELLRNYCFKIRNHSDILEIHILVENNYQYDTTDLLEKHKALTQSTDINVCKHVLMVIIVRPIRGPCHNIVTSMFFNLENYQHFKGLIQG